MLTRLLLAVVVVMGMAGMALAAEPAAVEYSADETMETAGFAFEGKVYVSAGRERREQLVEGTRQITITRHDKKVSWTLLPEQQMYMETKLGTASATQDDLSQYEVQQTTVGPEEINGVMTTKSKIIMTGKSGDKLGGFWWVSHEGVMVKLDVIGVDAGSKLRMKKELKNLEIGRQDPALFEIPEGYTKMSLMNMMTGGAAQGQEQAPAETAGQAEAPPAEQPKKKFGFGLKDVIDMVK